MDSGTTLLGDLYIPEGNTFVRRSLGAQMSMCPVTEMTGQESGAP